MGGDNDEQALLHTMDQIPDEAVEEHEDGQPTDRPDDDSAPLSSLSPKLGSL